MKKITERLYRSYTDERLVIDVVATGYDSSKIKVDVIPAAEGKNPTIKVTAKKPKAKGYKFGFFKTLGKIKETFEVDQKFDPTKATVESLDGVIRISIPIKEERKGFIIHPLAEKESEE